MVSDKTVKTRVLTELCESQSIIKEQVNKKHISDAMGVVRMMCCGAGEVERGLRKTGNLSEVVRLGEM